MRTFPHRRAIRVPQGAPATAPGFASGSASGSGRAPVRRRAIGATQRKRLHGAYRSGLGFAFALSHSLRLLAYLPVIATLHASGDTSQHSLLTWLTWLFANLTMAGWNFEQNGHRVDRGVLLSAGSALMCTIVVVQILVLPGLR
jgi:hypothetical protein